MRPLTDTIPKPLVPIAGRPLLARIIDALPATIDELVLVVKYRGGDLRAHFGPACQGRSITYVEQGTPNGTGGALLAARPHLAGRFMVMNADDLHGSEALTTLANAEIAILGAISPEPQHFGVLTVSPEGTLCGIEEKPTEPKSNLVNTGTMVLDQSVFSYTSPEVQGEVRLTDMVMALAQDIPVRVIPQPRWCPVGRPEDIPKAEAFLVA